MFSQKKLTEKIPRNKTTPNQRSLLQRYGIVFKVADCDDCWFFFTKKESIHCLKMNYDIYQNVEVFTFKI